MESPHGGKEWSVEILHNCIVSAALFFRTYFLCGARASTRKEAWLLQKLNMNRELIPDVNPAE